MPLSLAKKCPSKYDWMDTATSGIHLTEAWFSSEITNDERLEHG